ncbi:MAG: ABC transporter permease, partial [Ruminococcus sp.]|nr:ABC transporter permease [Ruminococcus sp.]
MYFRILKKDLKRKKTMNIILLIFVILSAMFAASSVNNIISVTNGLDYFFDKSGMTDYFCAARGEENIKIVTDFLDSCEYVTKYGSEDVLYVNSSSIKRGGESLYDFSGVGILQSVDSCYLNLFTSDDEILKNVEKGKVYISGASIRKSGIKPGDKITCEVNSVRIELEFAGFLKDALLG